MNFIPEVEAKIARAKSLIEELDDRCIMFLNSSSFRVEREQLSSREWNLILRMDESTPLLLGVLVGDVVHNLRSSLDIAFNYFLEKANPTDFALLDNWSLQQIKFPIFDSVKHFEGKKWHAGLADETLLNDLREVQPFNFQDFADSNSERKKVIESSPLWQLHHLWNLDKHRGINLVVGGLNLLMLGLEVGQHSRWIQQEAPPWLDGSVIFKLEVESENEISNLNLSEEFAIGLIDDVRPLNVYPVASKLEALLGKTVHCHWLLQRWFEYK